MDEFLETHNLPSLNQEEKEYLNRLITTNEIKSDIKNSQQSPRPNGFTGEFYETFKVELTPILPILFQKNSREGKSQSHCMKPALS